MTPPNDYHAYVIQGDRFVGDFEGMYRDCADPWQQDAIEPVSEEAALSLLRRPLPRRVLDLGCGKGRFTQKLKQATGAAVTAIDVSPTAVHIASSRYPGIRFMAADVPPLDFPDGSFDLVVAAELLWYVLPKLKELFSEVRRVLEPSGRFLVLQTFYQPEQQKYGREVMSGPADLVGLLPFEVAHQVECDRFTNYKWVALCRRTP